MKKAGNQTPIRRMGRRISTADEFLAIKDPFVFVLTLTDLLGCQSAEDYHGLPETGRMAVALQAFHFEMEGGGFHHFLSCSSADLCGDIEEYLDSIGASKTCALLRRIAATFPDGRVMADCGKRNEYMESLEEQSDSSDCFSEETAAYRESGENILELLVSFLKNRKDEIAALITHTPDKERL